MHFRFWLLAVLFSFTVSNAFAAQGDSRWLVSAIAKTKKNQTLTVPAGEYDLTDVKIHRNITLKGEGDVIFFSSRTTAKGILNPLPFVSLQVENITFRGAVSRDQNGAGIRHDGRDLTVINCRFIENENGILATGDDNGAVTIERSEFIRNGHGDGYSHGIYLSSGKNLTIKDSRFIGTKIGHHIKSLARTTTVTGSTLDDDDGRTSYSIDASRGGNVVIKGNIIIQAAASDNESIINYDLTRGGNAKSLIIENNKIINRHRRGNFLRNDTKLTPQIVGNEIINESGGRLKMGAGAPKQASAIHRLQGLLATIRQDREAKTPPATAPRPLSLAKPRPAKTNKSFIVKAPDITPQDGALFSFRLENNSGEDSPADYLTFAHPLAPGVFTNAPLAVQFGNDILPVQADVKASHTDGSARHVIFTIATPPIKSGDYRDGAIIPAPRDHLAADAFDTKALLEAHYDLPVSLAFHNSEQEADVFYVNGRAGALAAVATSKTKFWLDGPLVKAFRFTKNAAPHLQLRFDISIYRDGDIRTSIAFANDKTFTAGARAFTYDVAIGGADAAVYEEQAIAHHRSSMWRQVLWSGDAPALHIAHDLNALTQTGAILPLDPAIGVRRDVITANLDALADAPPLAAGLLEQYFPQGGGRVDIGIYPQWTANYLITQDQGAKAVMLANGEAAGSVPWHFRDERTGAPVRIDHRKKFWADERGQAQQYAPDRAHPDVFEADMGGWTPDHAHKPSLAYIPYLVTGDPYFAELMAMQAAYAIFGRWPDLREGGLKAIDVGQVRASAWSLRDLSNAAYILPDNDALKGYFRKTLHFNLTEMAEKYVANRASRNAGALEGYIDESVHREPERISPWQNDFLAMALWQTARQQQGDSKNAAEALLNWSGNFHAGRFLTNAYAFNRAPAYILAAKIGDTDARRTSWQAVAKATFGAAPEPLAKMEGYPNYGAGYIGSAYGTLAALASQTKALGAYEAFARLAHVNQKHGMWRKEEEGGVAKNNSFIFTLSSKRGHAFSRETIFKKHKNAPRFLTGRRGSDTLNGGAYGDLLFSFSGKDKLNGAGGDDDLFGGADDDTLDGGEDNDRLVGGAGDDVLIGGAGADLFAFRYHEPGNDSIADFNPAEDMIGVIIKHGDTAPDLETIMTAAPEGVWLKFSENSSVLLEGVSAAQIKQDHIKPVQ